MLILLLVFLAISALILYLWFEPSVPDGYKNPKPLRILQIFVILMFRVAKVKSLFYGTFLGHLKGIQKSMANIFRPKMPEDLVKKFVVTDKTVSSVAVRVYSHKETNNILRPGIIFIRGGGWTLGTIDGYNVFCLLLAEATDATVMSIDYRLADEVTGSCFPTPFNDCLVAAKHFLANPTEFGVNPKRVAILGDSAGGNLVAAVSLKLRDEGISPTPKLQLLLYPALQCIDFSLPSYQQNSTSLMLWADVIIRMWSLYATGSEKYARDITENRFIPEEYSDFINPNNLSTDFHYKPYEPKSRDKEWKGNLGKYSAVLTNPYFAPLMAKSLVGLPEAYVFTAQHDVLRDDGLLYVRRLREAGVKVTHNHSPIGFHGMFGLIKAVPESRLEFSSICNYINLSLK